ncbi:hypothetical protein POM88_004290 [Heracleum sosnowskyi]|uniref:Uncharacterized protein n=1 Tax=Heracleum sosnowskyi TaxID=360622 RepID=A0AAD8N7I9_9APIA|nr:hypothetical protein POM88_004290 [Heracleum sosnowskyi]
MGCPWRIVRKRPIMKGLDSMEIFPAPLSLLLVEMNLGYPIFKSSKTRKAEGETYLTDVAGASNSQSGIKENSSKEGALLEGKNVCTIQDRRPLTGAVDINPITREKSIVEVLVSYQQKPKVCSGCKSLGHLVSVCPTSIRKWVAKDLGHQNANNTHEATTKQKIGQTDDSNIANAEVSTESDIEENTTVVKDMSQSEGWTTVISKRSKFSGLSPGLGSPFPDESPPPANTFKNLKRVDEIDMKRTTATTEPSRLSNSHRKKMKKGQGISSPSQLS